MEHSRNFREAEFRSFLREYLPDSLGEYLPDILIKLIKENAEEIANIITAEMKRRD